MDRRTADDVVIDELRRDPPGGIRSSWIEWGLAAALVTVFLGTVLRVLGTPSAIQSISFLGIGKLLSDVNKAWLLMTWACGVVAVVLVLVRDRVARPLPWARLLLDLFTIGGIAFVLLLAIWQNAAFPAFLTMWVGFGFTPVILGLVIAVLVVGMALKYRFESRMLLPVSIVIVVALGLPSLVQTPKTFTVSYDLAYTLNELLAVSAGRLPAFDFITQYETLLGFPLALIAAIVPGVFRAHPEVFAVAWLVILQISTLMLAIIAVAKVTPRALRWLIPLVIVPVAYLPGPLGLPYYADLPMRLLLPTLMLAGIVYIGMRRVGRSSPWWVRFTLGVLGGIAMFNNLDFGGPAAIAGLITVLISARGWFVAARNSGQYLLGLVSFPLLYIALGSLTGRRFSPDYFLFFVRSFGLDGFMNVNSPVFGLHSGFVFVGILGLVVGALGIRRLTNRNLVISRAIVFQSSWLLLSLVYFSGRALTPTLVTGYSLELAVLLALLLISGLSYLRLLKRYGWRDWRIGDLAVALVTVLALAFPVAAWTAFPTVNPEVVRLSKAILPQPGTLDFLRPNPTTAIAAVPAGTRIIGMVAVSGSTWSQKLGVVDANLFLHPDYLAFATGSNLECGYLRTLPGDVIVTPREEMVLLQASGVCQSVLDFASAKNLVVDDEGSVEVQWLMIHRR